MSIERPVEGPPESVTPTSDSTTAKITGHSSESAEKLATTVSAGEPNEVSQESIISPENTTVCIDTEIRENEKSQGLIVAAEALEVDKNTEQRQEQTIPDENSGIDQIADLSTESIEERSTSPLDIQSKHSFR